MVMMDTTHAGSGRRQKLCKVGFAGALVAVLWLLLPFRAADPVVNQYVSILAALGAFAALAIASACLPTRRWFRVTLAAGFLLADVAISLLLFLSMVAGGPIVGYENLDSIELAHSTVVAYRTNGGATVPYCVQVVQELPVLLPGIVIARDLYSGCHQSEASLTLSGRSILVALEDRKDDLEVSVLPFVYF